jgi:hypothetical protein
MYVSLDARKRNMYGIMRNPCKRLFRGEGSKWKYDY